MSSRKATTFLLKNQVLKSRGKRNADTEVIEYMEYIEKKFKLYVHFVMFVIKKTLF